MSHLRAAVEKRKDFIIKRLIKFGYIKHMDGRQLYEMPLAELERLYISMMCDREKDIEIEQVRVWKI